MLESGHVVAFAAATDLRRAREFYEGILGLRVTEQTGFACVLDANGTMVRVTAVPEVCRAGYTILGWRVPDIATAVRGLADRGVIFLRYDGMTRTVMASGPLLTATRSPGSPTQTAIPCRSPSSTKSTTDALTCRRSARVPGVYVARARAI
jgi:hypothetical protein